MKKIGAMISRRGFLVSAAFSGGALLLGGRIYARAAETAGVARLFTREPGRLRMLAFTDIHFFTGRDKQRMNQRTGDGLKAMIRAFDPELFLVNGDTWHEGGTMADDYATFAIEQFSSLGVPWALVYGNHDHMNNSEKIYKLLAGAPNSLFRGGDSRGNYRVEVFSPGAEQPFWSLIMVNDCGPERGFNQPQIEWFRAEAGRIREQYPEPPPAFVFAHIPVPQLGELWKQGKAKGVKGERFLIEGSLPEAFAAFQDAGFVKAFFAGHNHLDNYWGEAEGIRLQFLRATGYGGYGGLRLKKGGTLITVDTSGPEPHYQAVTVFPSGKTWRK